MNQWSMARADPDGFREGMVSFFRLRGPEHEADADADTMATARRRWASLILFDFMCHAAITTAPDAFEKLVRCSYLMDPSTGQPLPLEHHFSKLMAPIRAMSDRQELDATPVVVGCQEMPVDVAGEEKLRQVLPSGLTFYRPTGRGKGEAGAAGGTDEGTGFIFSKHLAASLGDVTDHLTPKLLAFLTEQGVKPAVAQTTLRKLLVVTVALSYGGQGEGARGSSPPRLAVATLHCKCFYKQVGDLE